jgi:hypothetical protein
VTTIVSAENPSARSSICAAARRASVRGSAEAPLQTAVAAWVWVTADAIAARARVSTTLTTRLDALSRARLTGSSP